MRTAVLVEERDRGESAAAEADLRSLDISGQGVGTVAADSHLVNKFDRGAGREKIQIVAGRKCVAQRLDDWPGDLVLGGVTLEAVFDREGHLDRAVEIFDRPAGHFD